MSTNTDHLAHLDTDEWHGTRVARGLHGFAPLMPLATFAGCAAVVMTLWPVVPGAALARWFNIGLALTAALSVLAYCMRRAHASAGAHPPAVPSCRAWLVAASLAAGVFWATTSFVVPPEASPAHLAALALTLAAVTSLWLPLFVVERVTLVTYAVPALLPMALNLLFSPAAAPIAAMGGLLFVVLAALAAAAHMVRNMLDADAATHRALYHRATHDGLVGLANRAEFDRRIELVESAEYGPYAVVFIDIDDFKRVNDTAGHAHGDRVLREVGAILRDEKRRLDVAARIGGDEFAILMALCSDREALRVARAVSRRIAALASSAGGVGVTASIGIACSVPGPPGSTGVVEAADRACYAAKRAGRNRIELARDVGAAESASAAPQASVARFEAQAPSRAWETSAHPQPIARAGAG